MKPINIKISAFGPYKDEVFIDFTKFYDSGIFLITGDTGSGKTTIFDAICFALFGSASGSNREKNSFRSDFAKDEVKTYVELEFSHKDVIYKINRSPSYMRKKVRGEGYTQVTGDASISFLDTVISGDKNVCDKCREILGIDYSQFKQISMIAQGEFLKLLYAKASERSDIFRRIFDTYIYRNISDSLKKKYLDKKREYEDKSISLDSLKDSIIFDEDKDLNINTDELLELISNEISRDANVEEEKENSKREILSKIQDITNKISSAMMINDSFNSYDLSVKRLDELKKEKKDIKNNKDIININKNIYEIIIPVFQELSKLRKVYCNKLEQLDINNKLYDEKLRDYNKTLDDYNKLDVNRKKVEELKNRIKEYENKLPLFLEINNLSKTLEEKKNIYNLLRLNELEEILDKFDKNRSIKESLKKEQDNILKLKTIYDMSNKEYNLMYNKFISCQAGIIASGLKDGCECPVCGSIEHPNKAKLDDDSVTKEDVDRTKDNLDKCQIDVDMSSNIITSLQKELEISNKEIFGIDEEDIKMQINNISNNVNNVNEDIFLYDIVSIQKDISYIEAQIENKSLMLDKDDSEEDIRGNILRGQEEVCELELFIKNISNDYDKILKEKVGLESLIKVLKNEIKELDEDIKIKDREYIDSYSKLGYRCEEEYLEVKLEKENIVKLEEKIINFDKEFNELNSKIKTLNEFIKDKKRVDTIVLEKEKEQFNIQLSDIELSLKSIHGKINNNKIVFDKIKDVYQKTKNIEKELAILEDLSNTANGTIKGKNKLEFEQYVQASYFDDVLVSANERFSYMTDSRYLLLRRVQSNKVSDKLGLELEVFDNYTGKRRDITTLSGGEAFKASLSLALGMSDVIQSYSGGIVVDTMFIDEGFGSLDSESLEQAMNAIMRICDNDRLIGIISHVNELKDRIDKKIVITKSNIGSSVSVVV